MAGAVLTSTVSSWENKGLFVTFNQETTSDINYQVFYTIDEKEGFNEPHAVKYQAQATESSIKIQIPETHIAKFRLDPGVQPEKITISNLKLMGDILIELSDFDEFTYSKDVENKIVENNKVTILSNQSDPYMTYKEVFNLNEGIFIDWTKATLIGVLSFFTGFFLLGFLFRKRKTKE